MKSKTLMKFATMCAAGGVMLQLGGCFGEFWRLMLINVPIGAGRALGAIPAGLISDLITPLLPAAGA
jgi:hypothetical protein